MPELINIADILPMRAEQLGGQIAIRCPGSKGPDGFRRYDDSITYQQLDQRSTAIAKGLQAYGIGQGVRAVVMLKPSLIWTSAAEVSRKPPSPPLGALASSLPATTMRSCSMPPIR